MNTSKPPLPPSAEYTTRVGKIARLPRAIREQLNLRIEDGKPAATILRWLNSLKEVKAILAQHFSAREISPQNLSDWKQGGHRDWLRQRHLRDQIRLIAEQAQDLATDDPLQSITDNLAALLAAELAVATQTLLAETTDPRQRWLYLRQSIKQLQQLRRGNHLALRTRMELERWEIEREQRAQAQRKSAIAAAKSDAMDPLREVFQRTAMSKLFGGGKAGEEAAEYFIQTNRNVKEAEQAAASAPPSEIKANQA